MNNLFKILIIQLTFPVNNKILIPYEFGIQSSKLIKDICNTYNEQISAQINNMKNNTININIPLDTTKIYKEPLEYIQEYFNTQTIKPIIIGQDGFEKFLQLFSTVYYFEIDDYIHYLRKIFLKVLSNSTDIDDARINLNFSSSFNYMLQPDEVYNRLIKYSWNNKTKKINSIKLSKRNLSQMPNLDIAKSNVFVSKYNNQSQIDLQVPHEINERRRLIEKTNKHNKQICNECKTPFTTMYRAHTCRSCGARIHYGCSSSASLKFTPIKTDSGSVISYFKNESIVCKKCKEILNKTGSIYSLWYQFIMNIKLPIYYSCRLAALTEEWYVAVKNYIITFKSLQHRLPITDYTQDEKNMLWYNRFDFTMHSLWLIQLLKITDFSKIENCFDIYRIIKNDKVKKSCEKLYCSKSCDQSGLKPIDCIVILNKHLFKNIPPVIKCLLVSILNNNTMLKNNEYDYYSNDDLINKELINYLPHLVHYFRFDESPDDLMNNFNYNDIDKTINSINDFEYLCKKCDNSPLIHMIFKRALPNENGWSETSKQLCYELHWLLSVETSNIGMNKNISYDYSYSGLYNYLKSSLIVQLNKTEEGQKMVNSINAQYQMIDILNKKDKTKMKTELIKLINKKQLFLPCDSSILVEDLDLDKIKVMDSATKPVVLPFICSYIDNLDNNYEEKEEVPINIDINDNNDKTYNINNDDDIIIMHNSCKLSEINKLENNDLIQSQSCKLSEINQELTQNKSCKLSEINKLENNILIQSQSCKLSEINQESTQNKSCKLSEINKLENNDTDDEYFNDSEDDETEKFMNISSSRRESNVSYIESCTKCNEPVIEQPLTPSITPSNEQNNVMSISTSESETDEDNIVINLLYKSDDIRKDLIILKCKYIIQQILLNIKMRNESISLLPIICYRVQPITKSAGFIELVEGETLEKITDLKNYLLDKAEKNKSGINDFIKSVAVSTVLVYIFGIGDRHKENILITNDGLLLDIDFGFVEGCDTLCTTAYSRIPDEIMSFNDRQQIFEEWCQCFYLELRRYAIHFHSLFMLLHTSNEDDDNTLKACDAFIQDRFCVNDDELALKKLLEFIDNSRKSSLNNYIRDLTHIQQKTFNNLWNNSYESIIKWWYSTNKKSIN